MSDEGRTRAMMAVCMAVSVIAIAVAGYAVMSDEPADGYDEIRYTMFLGMSDRPAEYVQSVEDRMIELITSTGNGYTLEHECGGYVDNGQVFKDDVSLKFIVVGAQYTQITGILDAIMEEFSIPAVYVEREDVSSGFYTG